MNTVEKLVALNPFPGLRAFNTHEADRFFGRQQQIQELADKLATVSFVAVAGSSGCGKSSLVRAGLLSELSNRTETGSKTVWHAVVMRPGIQPIANLAEQLSSVIGQGMNHEVNSGTLYGRLQLGGLGLVEAVRLARLDPHVRLLVVVDQFEEVFRFKRMASADEASAFVKLLLHAADDPESPVSVVITLRSDTLGYCADFRDLPEAINRGQFLVPKLTRDQRKETIVGPIVWRRSKIAPRLVQRLLNDVSDDFDDLPVMQHTLARTWNRWAEAAQGSRPIDLEDYVTVGTTKEALSRHANEAFESLPGLAAVVEKVFRTLTECIADGTEVRRALDLHLLCESVGGDPGLVHQAVERFRRPDTAFLMPGQEIALTNNTVIDISHESLIRLWQRLRKWVQAEAQSRVMLERLVDAACRHETHQGELWHNRDLERALEWKKATNPTPAWVGLYVKGDGVTAWQSATSFLQHSTREQRRDERRRKLLIGGVCVLGLAVVVVGIVAAGIRFNLAKSRELASEAQQGIEQNPARSAQLALAVVQQDLANEPAMNTLRQSLAALEVAHTKKIIPTDTPASDVRYTNDGSLLVTASGKTVTIYDSKNYQLRRTIERKNEVLRAWLIANNKILITQTADGEAQIQTIDESSIHPLLCQGKGNRVSQTTVSPDDQHIAIGCYDGDVLVWNTNYLERKPNHTYTHKVTDAVTVTALAFSYDGTYLASGDAMGNVNLWKLGHPSAWIGIDGLSGKASPIKHDHYSPVRDIAFHPANPNLLVTTGDDVQAIVWGLDLEHRRLARDEKKQSNRRSLPHKQPVTFAKFTPPHDGLNPLVTVAGKTTKLWWSDIKKTEQGRSHDDRVTDADVSTDGEWLVTASADHTARIWSTRSNTQIAVLRGHTNEVNRTAFSHDGTQIVTASADGTVRIWNFRAPRLLASSDHQALSATFEPSGARVAVSEEQRVFTLKLNGAGSGKMLAPQDLAGADTDTVSRLSWSKDGKYLAGVKFENTIEQTARPILWDLTVDQAVTPSWLKRMQTAAFSPSGDELLSVSPGQIVAWDMKDLSTAVAPRRILTIEGKYTLAAMSPDGKWIAAINEKTFDLFGRDGQRVQMPEPKKRHTGTIESLQFSPDSKRLLTVSADRTAMIWPLDTPGSPKTITGGRTTINVSSASFSRNGRWVVTGGLDGNVRLWNAETGKRLVTLRRHSETVNSVEFSPDNKWILSASDDGTVYMGECDAYTKTVEELKQDVAKLVTLSEKELAEIQEQATMPFFTFPQFLFW